MLHIPERRARSSYRDSAVPMPRARLGRVQVDVFMGGDHAIVSELGKSHACLLRIAFSANSVVPFPDP